MSKELTKEEQAEFDAHGAVRLTVKEFRSRISDDDGKPMGPTELGNYLGVTRTQVYNYQMLGRVIDWNPKTGDFKIIETETEINKGTLGVVKPRKIRATA